MNKRPNILAVAAHPDDIEFMMAGTLLLLKEKNCNLHYFNIANGCCGTDSVSKEDIIRIRADEGRAAAIYLGATFYPSITDDFKVFYNDALIKKVAAVIRRSKPDIVLVQSLQDYMDDHMISARITAAATFVRNMPNYTTDPPEDPYSGDVAIYHALPHGLMDEMRQRITPDFYLNITSVIERKVEMLALHKSQKQWLDKSQGMDSYLKTMKNMSHLVGQLSDKFEYAEGWRRHSHLGFCPQDCNPLIDLLYDYIAF